jgi:hypothetical protein
MVFSSPSPGPSTITTASESRRRSIPAQGKQVFPKNISTNMHSIAHSYALGLWKNRIGWCWPRRPRGSPVDRRVATGPDTSRTWGGVDTEKHGSWTTAFWATSKLPGSLATGALRAHVSCSSGWDHNVTHLGRRCTLKTLDSMTTQ